MFRRDVQRDTSADPSFSRPDEARTDQRTVPWSILVPNWLPEDGGCLNVVRLYIKEAWESTCYSSHVSKFWHRPICLVHADMYINDVKCIGAYNGCLQIAYRILHTHGRHCCFDFWQIVLELPDSEPSSTKRQVTPFLYIGPHPSACTLAGIGINQRTGAKIVIFFNYNGKGKKKQIIFVYYLEVRKKNRIFTVD